MKDIPGYEGRYAITEDGKVWSYPRKSKWGTQLWTSKGRFLTSSLDVVGYMAVGLSGKRSKTHRIHRLLAMTFIPNPENKKTVNHINGIKADNRLENLEWATYLENNKHARRMGLNKSRPWLYVKKNRRVISPMV